MRDMGDYLWGQWWGFDLCLGSVRVLVDDYSVSALSGLEQLCLWSQQVRLCRQGGCKLCRGVRGTLDTRWVGTVQGPLLQLPQLMMCPRNWLRRD